MVNLRLSLNAERAEFAETFHAENAEPRRCAEAGHHSAAGGCRPPCVRHIDREAARNTNGDTRRSRLCFRAASRSMPRAARPTGVLSVAFSLRVTRPLSVLCVKSSPRALLPLAATAR